MINGPPVNFQEVKDGNALAYSQFRKSRSSGVVRRQTLRNHAANSRGKGNRASRPGFKIICLLARTVSTTLPVKSNTIGRQDRAP